jgi:cyanophycin synthetase
MRITNIQALPGPNIYLDRPVLRARIELDGLTGRESCDLPGFVDRLLARLPGLAEHHCAKGAPGGFVERLHGGTYFGHTVEHVCQELTQLAGPKVAANFGKTLAAGAPGRFDMIVEYRNEAASRFLLQVALELVEAVLANRDYPLDEKLAEARRIADRTDLGPSCRAIVEAAQRRDIPWFRLDTDSLVQLGTGCRRRLIKATLTDATPCLAADVAGDKGLTKTILARAAIPVPDGVCARSEGEAVAALARLGAPVAVKPRDGNQGKGVSLRLRTPADVAAAFRRAREYSSEVIVEEQFLGRDYRLLVVAGRLVAAAERLPAHVVGDGRSTIDELVARENANPLRGGGHDRPLSRIVLDGCATAFLARCGRRRDDVPAAGERVFLRETANLSTGGIARDVTDEVHPDTARLCERAARLIGLDVCGIDLITPDIAEPLPEAHAGILELNASPGIRMHHHPTSGRPRDVGGAIVDALFPPGTAARIPVFAVTGTNGKTTVTRMIGEIMAAAGQVVGMTTTDGIWIDGHRVAEGDMTGFRSARTVLSDPLVEVAVLETARGGLIRSGLGYDWADVAVLTNIAADHLGQDGLETLDDLLHVKSLVAERVREGGTLVLNAEDERLAGLPAENPRLRAAPRRVVYFARDRRHPVIRRHLAAGGTAFVLMNGWLTELTGSQADRIIRESAIPATLGGTARCQTANALAAAAAARARGVARETVAAALGRFRGDRHNPGRLNFYRVGRGTVLVDYGHNPAAFAAICELAAGWHDRRTTAVFTVPGDRDDRLLADAARVLARGFDRLIVREDRDLRGRQRGDVARILCEAVAAVNPGGDCTVILDERAALRRAIETMVEGEVVAIFYEDLAGVTEVLDAFGAEPVAGPVPALTARRA